LQIFKPFKSLSVQFSVYFVLYFFVIIVFAEVEIYFNPTLAISAFPFCLGQFEIEVQILHFTWGEVKINPLKVWAHALQGQDLAVRLITWVRRYF